MDLVTIEKLRAMKSYRKTHFLISLNQYCLIAFILGLCVSMVFPFLCSSIKLLFVPLQDAGAFAVGPKFLFLVCNMIVIYLIGGSKIMGQSGAAAASPASAIYDEYVKERRGLGKASALEGKHTEKFKLEMPLIEGKEGREEGLENKMKTGKYLYGEEKCGLSSYLLKKRSEDFIARVNRERRLEAERLAYSGSEQWK